MSTKPHISFVSPVYMGEHMIEYLVKEIEIAMDLLDVPYEVILVDDRSPDNSWTKLKELSKQNDVLKAIRLSRNFGQHPAIFAGLSEAQGKWVVILDCDLQDQPKEVIKLYEKAKEGYDAVIARRNKRKDSFCKKMGSYLFSKLYTYLTDTKYQHEIANYGIYNRKVVDAILSISDYIKFFPLFVNFVGFNTATIEVEHGSRKSGESSYSFKKLVLLAFNTIISFSNKPLKLFVKFGILTSVISFLFGLYNIYLSITGQITVSGYTSIMVSIWFLSGIIITTIGVTGIYIGKIFDQTKSRPVFIIDEIV